MEFNVFATKEGSSSSLSAKYAAPPRRPTGVVLVGSATRMPGVFGFIKHVCGEGMAHLNYLLFLI